MGLAVHPCLNKHTCAQADVHVHACISPQPCPTPALSWGLSMFSGWRWGLVLPSKSSALMVMKRPELMEWNARPSLPVVQGRGASTLLWDPSPSPLISAFPQPLGVKGDPLDPLDPEGDFLKTSLYAPPRSAPLLGPVLSGVLLLPQVMPQGGRFASIPFVV
jgi:hypothetical protein